MAFAIPPVRESTNVQRKTKAPFFIFTGYLLIFEVIYFCEVVALDSWLTISMRGRNRIFLLPSLAGPDVTGIFQDLGITLGIVEKIVSSNKEVRLPEVSESQVRFGGRGVIGGDAEDWARRSADGLDDQPNEHISKLPR